MCNEGRTETKASGTYLLERDLICIEDGNRWAFATNDMRSLPGGLTSPFRRR